MLNPALVKRLVESPEDFIRTCIIVREDGSKGPMVLTAIQQEVLAAILAYRFTYVVKHRQAKISTLLAMWLLHEIEYAPGNMGALISNIFSTTETVWQRVDDAWQQQVRGTRVPATHSGVRGIRFAHGGWLRVLTASSKTPGIGQSIDRLVPDEFGFWPDQERAYSHLMPAINKRPNARMAINTTPGPHGSGAHRLWMAALGGDTDNRFHPVFLKWWTDPSCVAPVPPRFKPDNTEYTLMERMPGITYGHLQFRRVLLASEFLGDIRLFDSKYPPSPEEGWYTTSRPAIPDGPVKAMLPGEADPEFGKAWEEPEPEAPYLLCADPNSYGKTGDPSAYSLWHLWDAREVAAWSGRMDPAMLADELAALGKQFNHALIAVESNAAACVTQLVNGGYRNVYFNDDSETHPGWYMTGADKDRAHRHLVAKLREGTFKVRSRAGLCQLLAYDGRGKRHKKGEHHFDRVITYLIAASIMETRAQEARPPRPGPARTGNVIHVASFLKRLERLERKQPPRL